MELVEPTEKEQRDWGVLAYILLAKRKEILINAPVGGVDAIVEELEDKIRYNRLIKSLKNFNGKVSQIADYFNVSRSTIYRWCGNFEIDYKSYKEAEK